MSAPEFKIGDMVSYPFRDRIFYGVVVQIRPQPDHEHWYRLNVGSVHPESDLHRVPTPYPTNDMVECPCVTDDMVDRYLSQAAEYGAMETMPPYMDRVRGLIKAALGQR